MRFSIPQLLQSTSSTYINTASPPFGYADVCLLEVHNRKPLLVLCTGSSGKGAACILLCFRFVTETLVDPTNQRDTPYHTMLCSAIKMRWGIIWCCELVGDSLSGFYFVLFFLHVFNFILNNEFLLPLPF